MDFGTYNTFLLQIDKCEPSNERATDLKMWSLMPQWNFNGFKSIKKCRWCMKDKCVQVLVWLKNAGI